MSVDLVIAIVMTLVAAATPILWAALGELVVEKGGVMNIGIEGMMLVGAVVAVGTIVATGNYWLGILLASLAGAATALIFGFVTLTLGANQIVAGLAIALFGASLSALVGRDLSGLPLPLMEPLFPAEVASHPLAKLVLGHSALVYLSLLMVPAVWWFINRSRAGLVLRAVGENHDSAHAIGYAITGVRYAAVAFGGLMAGIAGSCFPYLLTPQWSEGVTSGRGWIALALVVFAAWRPFRLLGGAYFFAVLMTLELYAKASSGFQIVPSEVWASLPYAATLLVLVFRRSKGDAAPACLGRPFSP